MIGMWARGLICGYATQFMRDHPLIIQLSLILGLSEEQVDDFWLQAASL